MTLPVVLRSATAGVWGLESLVGAGHKEVLPGRVDPVHLGSRGKRNPEHLGSGGKRNPFFRKEKKMRGIAPRVGAPERQMTPHGSGVVCRSVLKSVLAQRKELANLWNFEEYSVLSIHTSL